MASPYSLVPTRMQRLLVAVDNAGTFAKRVLLPLAGVIALLLFSLALYRAWGIEKDLGQIAQHSDALVVTATDGTKATFDNLNRPCGLHKPCGTFADMREVLKKGSDAIVMGQIVAQRETAFLNYALPGLVTQAHSTLSNLDDATAQFTPLAVSARARIDALEPIETNAALFVSNLDAETARLSDRADDTLLGVNHLVRNPQIPILLANAASITSSGASMMATGDAVLKKSTHNYLHPSNNPFVRTFQNIQPYALFGARIAVVTAPAW